MVGVGPFHARDDKSVGTLALNTRRAYHGVCDKELLKGSCMYIRKLSVQEGNSQ